jgi:hypothetical protein
LKKAKKYKKKYNLSDSEFEEFRRIYERNIAGDVHRPQHLTVSAPNTNLSRTLGNGVVDMNEGLRFAEDDWGVLNQILVLHAQKKTTHAQVVLQSISYNDVAYEAIAGNYDSARNNPHCHVHPVIAALFMPKITIFDEHMLLANMAYIVKQRYTKQPIYNKYQDTTHQDTQKIKDSKYTRCKKIKIPNNQDTQQSRYKKKQDTKKTRYKQIKIRTNQDTKKTRYKEIKIQQNPDTKKSRNRKTRY